MAWRAGMKCECIDISGGGVVEHDDVLPVVGGKYTVTGVYEGPYFGELLLILAECPRGKATVADGIFGYRATRFRPLTDISLLEEIRDGKRRVADADTPVDPAFERAMAEAYPGYVPAYVRERI